MKIRLNKLIFYSFSDTVVKVTPFVKFVYLVWGEFSFIENVEEKSFRSEKRCLCNANVENFVYKIIIERKKNET